MAGTRLIALPFQVIGIAFPESTVQWVKMTHTDHLRVSGMRHQNPIFSRSAGAKRRPAKIGDVHSWLFDRMKKLDISAVPSESGGTYPRPFDEPCIAQSCQRLARFAGLTQFGVNLTVIEPGSWSSQRHWHSHEDEFVWVLDGELTLVTNAGEETLRSGDCAAFRSGDPDGHHLINKSGRSARVLEIGITDPRDRCTYSDIDMIADASGYSHRDGTPYPPRK